MMYYGEPKYTDTSTTITTTTDGTSTNGWNGTYTQDSTTSSDIIFYPSGTGAGGTISSPSNGGMIITSFPDIYQKMEMPREDMPISIFVAGRMLTLGIIGSDVEAVYMGENIMMFKPSVLNIIQFNTLTLSVEYKDEIYHYNVVDSISEQISVDLLSVISK